MTSAVHTLLLVDDEPAILAALRRTLRGENYRILTTSDPTEVLGILERERVDLLVSDIDMPQMSGVELVAQVRRAHPDVVRILLTGRGSLDTALRAINDGEVYRYLQKPWDDTEIRETIFQAIQRLEELRRAAAASRASARRKALLDELEREHPGILDVSLIDGRYVITEHRLAELSRRVREPELRALLAE